MRGKMRLKQYIENESIIIPLISKFKEFIPKIKNFSGDVRKAKKILNIFYTNVIKDVYDSTGNKALIKNKNIFTSKYIDDNGNNLWFVTNVIFSNKKWNSKTDYLEMNEPKKKGNMFDFSDEIVKSAKKLGINGVYFKFEK